MNLDSATDQLWSAVSQKNVTQLRYALACGATLNMQSVGQRMTVLHAAAMNSGTVEFDLLCEAGAKRFNKTAAGLTPLDLALARNNRAFRLHVFKTHYRRHCFRNPCVPWLNVETVQWLLSIGATFADRFLARLLVCQSPETEAVLRLFMASGLFVYSLQSTKMSLISRAPDNTVRLFADAGYLFTDAQIQRLIFSESHALALSILQDQRTMRGDPLEKTMVQCVKRDAYHPFLDDVFTISRQAEPHHMQERLANLLSIAICHNSAAIPTLVRHGADPTNTQYWQINHTFCIPLAFAALDGCPGSVQQLLLSNADMDVVLSKKLRLGCLVILKQKRCSILRNLIGNVAFGLAHLDLPVLLMVHIFDGTLPPNLQKAWTMHQKWTVFAAIKKMALAVDV